MRSGMYLKLALSNISKNRRLFVPRILSEAGLLGCFYILITLAFDKRLSEALGGAYLSAFMTFGAVVIGLLSFVLILYVNSFLMKQRKSEYGLYNVLGMEKKHIVKVVFYESFFSMIASIALGLCFGMLFYKFASLLICKLLHAGTVAGFYYLSSVTVFFAAGIFALLDLFAFLICSISVLRMKPVELLAEKHVGEKEPKIKWALFVIGILCLGAGYYIAITTTSPLQALLLFFAAVILVIIGTYFLFVSGTVFVLKCLKKNSRYYYKKRHMPAVSGLLFRMKQNAVGLASIAILATGVLVMISTTASLYSGVEDTMNVNYPKDLYISGLYNDGDKVMPVSKEVLSDSVRQASEKFGLETDNYDFEDFLTVSYIWRGNSLYTRTELEGGWAVNEATDVIYITAESYNQMQGKALASSERTQIKLADDEIAYCRISSEIENAINESDNISVNGKKYRIKYILNYFPVKSDSGNIVNVLGIIVSDENVLDEIYEAQKLAYGEYASDYSSRLSVIFKDTKALEELVDELETEIRQKLLDNCQGLRSITLDFKCRSTKQVLEMYAVFLFLGILLGTVCLFSTILIIYYKQISEGYEDRSRFQIMQKIGMEKSEIRKTIGNQLILQFFLPLLTAAVHTAVASPILLRLLRILMLSNTALYYICAGATFIVFSLIYVIIYKLTARTYYKIVK